MGTGVGVEKRDRDREMIRDGDLYYVCMQCWTKMGKNMEFCWFIARTWVFLALHTTPSKTRKSSGKVLFNRKCKQYAQNTQQQPGHTSYQNHLERHLALTSLSLNLTSHLFSSTCTIENLFYAQRPTVGCCPVDSSFRKARQAWDKILTYPKRVPEHGTFFNFTGFEKSIGCHRKTDRRCFRSGWKVVAENSLDPHLCLVLPGTSHGYLESVLLMTLEIGSNA